VVKKKSIIEGWNWLKILLNLTVMFKIQTGAKNMELSNRIFGKL
jgi:hypothetical protein